MSRCRLYTATDETDAMADAEAELRSRAWARDLRRIWWFPPLHRGAIVLDLGSGAGDFARAARARGWTVDTLEPTLGDPTAEAWADAAPIQHYDAIFAWQVLEHLDRPSDVLRAIRRALIPGGYFVLSVPSARSLEAWIMRDRWEARHPGHQTEWTPGALRNCLRSFGFTRVRVLHQRIVKHVRGPWWLPLGLGCVVAALRVSSRITVIARP